MDLKFWKNCKVFLTGYTRFRGGCTAIWISTLGAIGGQLILAEKIADEYSKRHLFKVNINYKNKNNPFSILDVPNLLRKNRKK